MRVINRLEPLTVVLDELSRAKAPCGVQLIPHPSVLPWQDDQPSRVLSVGVDPRSKLGVLKLTIPGASWFSLGQPRKDGVRYLFFDVAGQGMRFPSNSEISLDAILSAMQVFLLYSGRRPGLMAWQDGERTW